MATGYEGFAQLGDALFGGPQQRAEAQYPKHLRESATAATALEKAAIARSQRIARENLPAAIAGDPLLSQRGDLATAILGMAPGQPNLGTYTGGLGDIADMEIDEQIEQKLQLGDVAGAQVLSAVKTDKVLPSLEAGGKAVFTPVTGDVDLTGLGDAALGATDALAGQRAASGQATLTRADAAAKLADARIADISAPPSKAVADAKIAWITAQANAKIAKGEDEALVDAWVNKELAEAGMLPEPQALGEAAPGFQSFDDIPPEARAKLREGVKTRFANGQAWSLVNGQPVRVQ